MTVAERAAADRDWRFGHLVVDEAQELSAMDWHVLLRRCPSRSITAVGDLAQRSAPAGAHAWADVLAPHLGSRWTYRTLTVNYRTPAEIMALAAAVLAEFAPDRQPPESVRATGEDPWQRTVPATDLAAEVRKAVEAEVAQLGRGTLAVIAADVDGLAGSSRAAAHPGVGKGSRVRRRRDRRPGADPGTQPRRPLRLDDPRHPAARAAARRALRRHDHADRVWGPRRVHTPMPMTLRVGDRVSVGAGCRADG